MQDHLYLHMHPCMCTLLPRWSVVGVGRHYYSYHNCICIHTCRDSHSLWLCALRRLLVLVTELGLHYGFVLRVRP